MSLPTRPHSSPGNPDATPSPPSIGKLAPHLQASTEWPPSELRETWAWGRERGRGNDLSLIHI
eukprot:5597517-Alexandrium_andersonii.AAC.1